MIHDATVEVTCDGEGCGDSVHVALEYKYHSYSGDSGQYDAEDESVETTLNNEHDWFVVGGKHYCCEECQP